jgi:murein DD-endopeptidase MepM/ murein hydrolase activator NlpD
LKEILRSLGAGSVSVLDPVIPLWEYSPIDLSADNQDLIGVPIEKPDICQEYVNSVLEKSGGRVAYGGYLEKRNLYNTHYKFAVAGSPGRNIHLGLDLWVAAGTPVSAPVGGRVHSFRNNEGMGDYGPTLILLHELAGLRFHTLYGHLSMESLQLYEPGLYFKAGERLGYLGDVEVNGGYAPHLHFQLICDMQGFTGDYPGVCNPDDLENFAENCPDPHLLLKF